MNRAELLDLFKQTLQAAERGDLETSAKGYEKCLSDVRDSPLAFALDERAQFIRSAAINCAQVLNKLGRYGEASEKVDFALSQSPTRFGTAIALSAKGEAICGLGRIQEGEQLFRDAIGAHPIIGALNSADSMTRIRSADLSHEAERLVQSVLNSYSQQLDGTHRAEAYTILGKLAVRRNRREEAREWFTKALTEQPNCEEARQQLLKVEAR
jgi:tetratricopeptide (TPR) repeat protein